MRRRWIIRCAESEKRAMNNIEAIVFNKHGIGHMVRVSRFPNPGETVRAIEWRFAQDAGKGTNVAVALGLLGVKTALVCKVGNDEGGKLGEQWLKKAGVDLRHYIKSPAVATDVGMVITQSDGENMIIGSVPHRCEISAQEICRALEDYAQAKFFLTGLEIDQQLPFEACRYAKQLYGMTTLLNASPMTCPVTAGMEDVDYLFINAQEGRQLANSTGEDWTRIAQQVREKYRPTTVVLTLGARGCLLADASGTAFYPAYAVDCLDSVGAGDGFMAAFAAALSWGMTSGQAADWANRYSAVVVGRRGAILSYPTLAEVIEISERFNTVGKEKESERCIMKH